MVDRWLKEVLIKGAVIGAFIGAVIGLVAGEVADTLLGVVKV